MIPEGSYCKALCIKNWKQTFFGENFQTIVKLSHHGTLYGSSAHHGSWMSLVAAPLVVLEATLDGWPTTKTLHDSWCAPWLIEGSVERTPPRRPFHFPKVANMTSTMSRGPYHMMWWALRAEVQLVEILEFVRTFGSFSLIPNSIFGVN